MNAPQIPGLTLRDYFAAALMQGAAANTDVDLTNAEMARWAYRMADAMIAERAKGAA